jgi:hypothetical protein
MRITFEMGARRKNIIFLGFREFWRIQEGAWHPNLDFCIGIWIFVRYDTQRWRFFLFVLGASERALHALLQSLTLFSFSYERGDWRIVVTDQNGTSSDRILVTVNSGHCGSRPGHHWRH